MSSAGLGAESKLSNKGPGHTTGQDLRRSRPRYTNRQFRRLPGDTYLSVYRRGIPHAGGSRIVGTPAPSWDRGDGQLDDPETAPSCPDISRRHPEKVFQEETGCVLHHLTT
jgi:hypothetical protein